MPIQQISPTMLKAWLDDPGRDRPQLIDVREPWEFEICHLEDARPLPMNSIPARFSELDPGTDIVLICHHGARSFQVAMFLERQGFEKLYNLHGGVAAWAHQVDPAMATY